MLWSQANCKQPSSLCECDADVGGVSFLEKGIKCKTPST